MSSLLDLPPHIIENIVDFLNTDALPLATTNSYLDNLINNRIYKKIIIQNKRKAIDTTSFSWKVQVNDYTTVNVEDIDRFSSHLRLTTVSNIQHILIASQTDGLENLYAPLYNILNKSFCGIQVDNLDINNVRSFHSITQSQSRMTAARIQYEGEDIDIDVDNHACTSSNFLLNPRKGLKNWNIYDLREIMELPSDENVEELNIFIEEHALQQHLELHQSKNQSQSRNQNQCATLNHSLKNLNSIYLNLPAATLSLLTSPELNTRLSPLEIDKLSLTTSHSFKNFGFKSINTKISFHQLNKIINLSKLKKLELKINCDFHNRCEDQCMIQLFKDWEYFVNTNNIEIELELLVLVNFKSNTCDGNLSQFVNLLNYHFPYKIFQNLKEFYVQIDDFTNMKKQRVNRNHNHYTESFDLRKLEYNIQNYLPNLEKLVIPDYFNLWFSKLDFDNSESQSTDFFHQMINNCNCDDCKYGRFLFINYSKFDSINCYKHKFKDIILEQFDSDNKYKIDTNLQYNFRFLNYIVNTLRDRFNFSHKNLFTINSILKMDEIDYSVTSENTNFNLIQEVMIHLCLKQRVKSLSSQTQIKHVNFGGIILDL